jgi:serine/threonine protein kinase
MVDDGDQGVLRERGALEARRSGYLVHGKTTKADLWLARRDDGSHVVVKDFRAKGLLVRAWGRLQLRREARFLELLGGFEGTPPLLARPDRDALVIPFYQGRELHFLRDHPEIPRFLSDLRRLMDAIHERGIVHNDLRSRENVLVVQPEGRVLVLDWAGAIRLPPGSFAHRLVFRFLRLVDEAAFIKWKRMLAPGTINAAEARFERRFWRWRQLWPFNRAKLAGRGRPG